MSNVAIAPPTVSTVRWHGAAFELDLEACRTAIVVTLLAEEMQLHDLADAAKVSRMSLWRFMQGRHQCSPTTVSKILRCIGVELKTVLRPISAKVA